MAYDCKTNQGFTYRIRLEGTLDRSIMDWFGGLTILPRENGETVLVGRFADQPALRGLVNQLWDLNMSIVSIERIAPEPPDVSPGVNERRQP